MAQARKVLPANNSNRTSSTASTPSSSASGNHKKSKSIVKICGHLPLGKDGGLDKEFGRKVTVGVRWGLKFNDGLGIGTDGGNGKQSIRPPACSDCSAILARPLICIECGKFGCRRAIGQGPGSGHIFEHVRKDGHKFAFDPVSGSLWCAVCKDVVHHADLDRIKVRELVATEDKVLGKRKSKDVKGRPLKKFRPWIPGEKELGLLDSFSKANPCRRPRGLRNIGSSCFMNVVLQSFLHNPLLQSYFVADRHNSALCPIGAARQNGVKGEGDEGPNCLCCEADKLFAEFHSNDTGPFGPTSFLYTMWKGSDELAGYAQHDAHEFFISALNLLHSSTPNSTEKDCKCIVHTVFSGNLRSEVKCGRCGNVTTTVDPMLDLSLDLNPAGKSNGNGGGGGNGNGKKGDAGKIGTGGGVGVNGVTGPLVETLGDCLQRYTSPEKLGSKQYTCDKCKSASQEATKQLTIKTLPNVLCIQFKRFEHSNNSHKLDNVVKFPLRLDMQPFTVTNPKSKSTTSATDDSPMGNDLLHSYDLFAVLNHEGELNTGHYVNYARHKDEWYFFDDANVRLATIPEVIRSNPYMLYYVKTALAYS